MAGDIAIIMQSICCSLDNLWNENWNALESFFNFHIFHIPLPGPSVVGKAHDFVVCTGDSTWERVCHLTFIFNGVDVWGSESRKYEILYGTNTCGQCCKLYKYKPILFIIFDTIFLCLYTLQNRILKLNINITPITKHILYKSECHLHTLADVCLFFNHMRLFVFYFRCQDRTQLPPESMCLNVVAVLVVFLQTLILQNTKQNKLHISFVYSSKYIENHIVNLPAAKFQWQQMCSKVSVIWMFISSTYFGLLPRIKYLIT